MNKPRLGHIHFLNVLPLTYGLNNFNLKEGLELRNGVPAVMNNDLLTGRVDASEVSSIVYARNYEDLLVLPDLCVRADGEVRSILLVSKKPIEEINEDKIILTAQSATAHCLLKIIMAKAYDASPRYYTRNLTPAHPVPNDATASLLIGDDALYVYHHQQKDKYYYYDLGREWKKLTDRCMVYAVWTVHKSFAQANPEGVQFIYDRLYRSLQEGWKNKKEAIASIIDKKPFTERQVSEYLNVIKWNLTEEYLDNLKVFYDLAYEQKLIPRRPRIRMADVQR